MDSLGKSALVGRLAGPLFTAVATLLAVFWGIEIDENTMKIGVDSTVGVISGLMALWGFIMPFVSKIRERKRSE